MAWTKILLVLLALQLPFCYKKISRTLFLLLHSIQQSVHYLFLNSLSTRGIYVRWLSIWLTLEDIIIVLKAIRDDSFMGMLNMSCHYWKSCHLQPVTMQLACNWLSFVTILVMFTTTNLILYNFWAIRLCVQLTCN